jgi:hypothetical protein
MMICLTLVKGQQLVEGLFGGADPLGNVIEDSGGIQIPQFNLRQFHAGTNGQADLGHPFDMPLGVAVPRPPGPPPVPGSGR